MGKKINRKKPFFLNLGIESKEELLHQIKETNLSTTQISTTCEALLFLETVEEQLKKPAITLLKIKELFALYEEQVKKLNPV